MIPWRNGVTERKEVDFLETLPELLFQHNILEKFWTTVTHTTLCLTHTCNVGYILH